LWLWTLHEGAATTAAAGGASTYRAQDLPQEGHDDPGPGLKADTSSSSITSSSELSFVAEPPASHKQVSSLPGGSSGARPGAGTRALVSDMQDLDAEIAAMERELSAAARSVGLHVS
jgi:hypothetical protein